VKNLQAKRRAHLVAKACGNNAPALGGDYDWQSSYQKKRSRSADVHSTAGTVPVKYAHKHLRMGLGAPQLSSTFVQTK